VAFHPRIARVRIALTATAGRRRHALALDDPELGGAMTFGEAVKPFFGKYATFRGRASRSEFWYF